MELGRNPVTKARSFGTIRKMMDAIDVSNALAWLVSDEGRYVTGAAIPIDAGWLNS
jgi:NAD(P)-dependent dehydrogenase (short-subunit alcohol dehydrogenase family)